ncbi:MAG: hypothetical protein ACRCVI_02435 [Mycoplasmoidaceae bacterium]
MEIIEQHEVQKTERSQVDELVISQYKFTKSIWITQLICLLFFIVFWIALSIIYVIYSQSDDLYMIMVLTLFILALLSFLIYLIVTILWAFSSLAFRSSDKEVNYVSLIFGSLSLVLLILFFPFCLGVTSIYCSRIRDKYSYLLY